MIKAQNLQIRFIHFRKLRINIFHPDNSGIPPLHTHCDHIQKLRVMQFIIFRRLNCLNWGYPNADISISGYIYILMNILALWYTP